MKWSLSQIAARLLVSIVFALSAGACGQDSQEPKPSEKAQEAPPAAVTGGRPDASPAEETGEPEETAPSTEAAPEEGPARTAEDEAPSAQPGAPEEAEERAAEDATVRGKAPDSEAPGEKAAPPAADFPEDLKMITIYHASYPEHKKGPVPFSHGVHVNEYQIGCGECHHDENGEPLANLAVGDPVQKCAECHPVPAAPEDEDEYQRAMHKNCRTCHAAHNKETGTKDAPVLCNQCHQKN
ncbi:cytochrome c3 family protein [Desulfatiglans anilini]|uniref:cytochrome c3 family protein n=1 Tax=Desulfatiglans anilini TaxID=90728 RepID=UPI000425A7DE|nr:cytochrome c3 family protein [Desulfatiglans anilini]